MDRILRRVNMEIIDCKEDEASNFRVELVDSSPFHLKGSFLGPEGTPYENGTFEADVVYPEFYPWYPMQVKFITKMYHPNISPVSGVICLNILQHDWSPALTLKTVLISLQALLSSPESSDSLDTEAMYHYKADKHSFEETARYWTWLYARGSKCIGANNPIGSGVDDAALAGLESIHIDRFEAFGFQRSKVACDLQTCLPMKLKELNVQIDILRKLNYRGSNVANIPDEVVIEGLLE